jgi:hypothetical protein
MGVRDVNPPVHAWAAWRVYKIDNRITGQADRSFLQRAFHKLLLNFMWWVNRMDLEGHNVFQGRFPGLGQHRRVRPKCGAADRRPPRTVWREGRSRCTLNSGSTPR